MRGSEFPRGPRKHLPRQSPESFLGPSNQKEPHNRKQSEAPQGSGQENRNSHKVADIDPHSNKKKLEPKSTKAKLPDPLTQEELDWLKRMQGEIVMKAHLNHFNGLPTANPEVLTKCRDGPGADRNSAVYQEIAKTRHVSQKHLSDTKDIPTFSRMSLDGIKDGSLQEVGAAIQLCKVWYKQSPAVYPTVKNGDLLLSSKPTEEHERILAKLRMPYPKEGSQRLECHEGQSSQRPENSWTDGSPADWEFHPRSCPDYDAYHSRFQTWLQTTIDLPCYVDIYHPTFFDGTAHADGERSMFVLDMSNYNTLLEMNDEETWLHWYENAEGYCHNLTIHNKNAECEERDRRKLARKAYLDAIQSPPIQSPNSPKANIYLRPAEQKDVVELLEIHNWYAKNSTCSAYIEDLDFDSILQRIQSCCSAKLPFIVAVDCRRASTPNTERILGYALATDFGGPQPASNFTAELEIFVRPEFKEQGIGRCLLDKLVEVCDPTYSPKGGCPFKPSADERWGYYPGGRRRLGRLIFAFSYIGNKELSEYKWVKKWLERACEFEEQGLLKGVRVKFGKL
ncbi:hypothetical protein ARAM_003740 [Aspergillus rambellii]|uniref:N-acetyltransferase domain-containing protein n=1 Tax=Aspergillus rambellii TaxID=308745 RepID=A0A0F8XTR1_9EURO|nr:hypothetical protein ARAM_003740 [Aspergillus rambellii]